VKRTTLII